MAVLGLRFCARAFSSCGKWGPLFITVRGPAAEQVALPFGPHAPEDPVILEEAVVGIALD